MMSTISNQPQRQIRECRQIMLTDMEKAVHLFVVNVWKEVFAALSKFTNVAGGSAVGERRNNHLKV